MISLRLLPRAWRIAVRTGLVALSPRLLWQLGLAWFHCRGSFAFLAELAARRFGHQVALRDDDGTLTYAELHRDYEALAKQLIAQLGLTTGRHVALAGHNDRTLVTALLALSRVGAHVLLLDPHSPRSVLTRKLAASPPDLVLHSADLASAFDTLDLRRATLPLSHQVPAGARLPRLVRPGQIAVMTSGTTDTPKRIARRPRIAALLPTFVGLLEALPIRAHRPTVIGVPLFHGHGLSTLAMAFACAAPVDLGRSPELGPLLARPPFAEPPIVVSVPTLLRRWLDDDSHPAQVTAIISGSAPLDARLCTALLDAFGPVLFNLYGSTEAGIISLASPKMLRAAPATVGHPLPGIALRLVGHDHQPVATGQLGRVHVRGPLVVQPVDGWLDTVDLGRLDDAGRLHIVGRADAMIISGGENVWPEVLEARLREHPAVREVAVTGVFDSDFGQRLRAWIVIDDRHVVDPRAIELWLKDKVERYERPKSITVVPSLPHNALGKIDRVALAALLASQ